MHNPVATYRLQFHKEFSFEKFEKAIPYLQKLGISTVYASPIFESTPGSTHGYDGLNPHKINPEIGTEEQLLALNKRLQQQGISWLQDIVPNHMAFHTGNPWLMDVLEKGQQSEYAAFFDTAWTGKIFHGRIMVPFLGNPLKEVIENKEIKIDYQQQRLVFNYFDNYYPLNSRSYIDILQECGQKHNDAFQGLLDQLQTLKQVEDPKTYALGWDEFRLQFASLMKHEETSSYVLRCIDEINSDAAKLRQIADEQVYQLNHWQRTDTKINFRRFFTVNGLIALNIHDEQVFQYHHKYIKELVDSGIMQGLRIDHIDGLYDPTGYLKNLRKLVSDETYIVVEKILEPGEELPQNWPIQGNSGYDYLAIVNNLFTEKNSREQFTNFYNDLVGDDTPIHEQILSKKAHILSEHMGGELDNLTRLFKELNLAAPEAIESLKPDELSLAIGELLIRCPVYRYYGNTMPLTRTETVQVRDILDEVRTDKAELADALSLLESALLIKPLEQDKEYKKNALRFYQRCMQFTGPLMAKGVEDTLMYTYNRFIAHNEVGDSPEAFGISVDEYHEAMIGRKRDWPLTLNATSTHDTKRGEDVRARLNVLTDMPEDWFAAVKEWQQLNAELKVDGAPEDNDEYFIYQSLLGVYAMPGQPEDDITNRLEEYLQKALREAKVNSNWATPNEEYENAVKNFAIKLLDKSRPFWKSFSAFQHRVADYGVVNSLAQVLLKFTSPGVPDTYQGTEVWDLSLVDPDNRRPIDYPKLQQVMDNIQQQYTENPNAFLAELWTDRFDARIKLWLTHTLYNMRKQAVDLFEKGDYIPVKVKGEYKDNIIAYARKYQQKTIVVVAALHIAQLCQSQQKDINEIDWKGTCIVLPSNVKGEVENLLLGSKTGVSKEIGIQKLFSEVPFALLKVQQAADHKRAAGVLMHITSLPSQFGIGDMGTEARKFTDFLHRTRQKYWQILPLNPTENGQSHSPYSSISSRAGNPLLISPSLLVDEGLLTQTDLEAVHFESTDKVDFSEAEKVKSALFDKAWQAYNKDKATHLIKPFEAFCRQEREWLNDFALYMLLKQKHNGQPWFRWPEQYRLRNIDALEELVKQHTGELQKTRWIQFIFLHQWKQLKSYCNELDIKLFGDLPFYTSYDSVDVWSNPEIFCLDDNGGMTGAAGVPPDGFSADGQLWGMPVFKWDVLKETGYAWWIERLRKNAELFDLLRLDHFRAFADYWEVPAADKTARNGKWQRGPRADFFRVLKKKLGDFALVAEDLGEIDEPVYELRDEFNMPGMKVLQFAFGDNLSESIYIPHNYTENFIVYTGTHDNNTTKGWYRKDADNGMRERINHYTGQQVSEDNVAEVFIRMAFGSVAKIAIVPIQDVLGLDENARMNKPASIENNWSWRLLPHQLSANTERYLETLTRLYNR
jgi:malto-oligosyltrehalose synthase/4-alpha-glucanotransferase